MIAINIQRIFLQDNYWVTAKFFDAGPSDIAVESKPKKQLMDQRRRTISHIYSKQTFLTTEAQNVIDLEEGQTQPPSELAIQNQKRLERLEKHMNDTSLIRKALERLESKLECLEKTSEQRSEAKIQSIVKSK